MNRRAKLLQSKVKAQAPRVLELNEGVYDVASATSGTRYRVLNHWRGGYMCECEWSKWHDTRTMPCTHVLAVEEHRARQHARRLSLWACTDDAQRQHRPVERVGVGLYATSRKAEVRAA